MARFVYWCIVCAEDLLSPQPVEVEQLKQIGFTNIALKEIELFEQTPYGLARVWVSSENPKMDSIIRLRINSVSDVHYFNCLDHALAAYPDDYYLINIVTPKPYPNTTPV